MGEDLFRLISTGLLAVIVLLLLLAVSQLGRLQRALREGRAPGASEPEDSPAPSEASPAVDERPVAVSTPAAEEATDLAETRRVGDTSGPDEEGPFERDGRWWFRRDGELLVYDERLEEWVDPNAAPGTQPEPEATPEPEAQAPELEPVVTSAQAVDPHPLDEAREWKAPAQTAPAQTAPVTETARIEEVSPAPVPEPVSAPAPIAETSEGTQEEAGTHWKCPACGVINGSTATSCRMCFAARP